MSTAHGRHAPATNPKPGSARDPFRHGWRYVKVKRPDGTVDFDQVPLTPEDLLFPLEGDFQVHTDMHNEDCLYLKTVLKSKLGDDPAAMVLSDCRVDFNVKGLRPLGPDVVVLFGHNGPRQDWGTFHVGKEKSRPGLTVEITSSDTRKNDLGIKVKFYHRAQVPFYVIVDVRQRGGKRQLKLLGYRWTAERYEPIPLDDQGRLRLPELNVWIGVKTVDVGERVVCFDPETGEEIADYVQISGDLKHAQADAREARAEVEAERQVRIELEAKLRAMEEKLRRLGGPNGDG